MINIQEKIGRNNVRLADRIAEQERRTEEAMKKLELKLLAKFEETVGVQDEKIAEQERKISELENKMKEEEKKVEDKEKKMREQDQTIAQIVKDLSLLNLKYFSGKGKTLLVPQISNFG